MPWQEYVDNALISHGSISKAGIYGFNETSDISSQSVEKWASRNFDPSVEELKLILTSFIDPQQIVAQGIFLEGTKFVCLSTNTSTIVGKRTTCGCVVMKTTRCLIVAVYESPSKNAVAALCTVSKLAEYLKANEF